MIPTDDIDVLAGEYVLGTLDAAERAAVAARRTREPVLDAAIVDWERRLAPLDNLTAAIQPPSEVFARIERRLNATRPDATNIADLNSIARRMRVWRRTALAASAVAASLLAFVVIQEALPRDPQTYVAVFAKDDVLPAFYLTIDLQSRELTLRPVGAERQPGKTYQMWIASDRLGPAPQSLGLVEDSLTPTRKSLSIFDRDLLQKATFGVSLEPAGGSPTGRPTSPALHGKLLPAVN